MSFQFIVATTTWNAIDILELFFSHYDKLGAKAILVMDYDSDDGSAELIKANKWRHLLDPVPFPGLKALDPSNEMLATAKQRFPGAWCLYCDPDELLSCRQNDVVALARSESWENYDSISIPRRNMTAARSAITHLNAVSAPAVLSLRIEERHPRTSDEMCGAELSSPWIFTNIPNKVMARIATAANVGMGDHEVDVHESRSYESESARLLHYPFRSYATFVEKVRHAELDFLSNPDADPHIAWQYRRWIRLYKTGRLEQEYLAQFIDDADVEILLDRGALVRDVSIPDFHSGQDPI